jgi:hypothetical protein
MTHLQHILPAYLRLFKSLPEQIALLKMWKKRSERFSMLLADTAARQACENLTLDAILLLPLQRIPKSVTILDYFYALTSILSKSLECLAISPPSHPDLAISPSTP